MTKISSTQSITTKVVTELPVSSHCPYRQATLLQQALTPDKMRVAFLLGAGCPTAIQTDSEGTKRPLVPAISELTDQVIKNLVGDEKGKNVAAITARLIKSGITHPNIEDILSHVRLLYEVIGISKLDGLSQETLSILDEKICQTITNIVQVPLPNGQSPYHDLAKWIRSIPRKHPIEVFTSNYDLLMEQALEELRVPYFDGFVGANRPFFDVASMEQDELPSRWVRLWKLHGSINWWRTPADIVERHYGTPRAEDRQMIYPSIRKYDQTRRMPFVAMMDRFRSFLRNRQSVLISCGYSFADDHLNDVIVQGLTANPTAICFGLIWGDRKSISSEIIKQARNLPNLSILAADGAVIGGFEKEWRSDARVEDSMYGLAVLNDDLKHRSDAPINQCKFVLGDFLSLGKFLAHQIAQTKEEQGVQDGK